VSALVDRDLRTLWHPYTQHATAPPPTPVVAAEGAWLVTADGRRILDAVSSWWTCLHGHGHPRLVRALAEQAARLDHVMFAGLTHEPAVTLAEQLAARTGLARTFFSDNGSTAVEVALKMAAQYHAQAGDARRTRFVYLPHAYHGDTVGAMSVGGVALFRDAYSALLFTAHEDRGGPLGDDVAGFIVEPIVQGAGGMRVHSPEFLRDVARRCRDAGALLIADEVMTGFGRTGKMFACEHAGVHPDLMCLSKGITGGMLPFAATLASAAVFDAFLSSDASRMLFHGHSYAGNPLGCAVALENLRIFDEEPVLERARAIGQRIGEELEALRGHPRVRALRGVGAIRAVEIEDADGYLARTGPRMAAEALRHGVLLRPLGNVLYTMPPYCIGDEEARAIGRAMVACVHKVSAAG